MEQANHNLPRYEDESMSLEEEIDNAGMQGQMEMASEEEDIPDLMMEKRESERLSKLIAFSEGR